MSEPTSLDSALDFLRVLSVADNPAPFEKWIDEGREELATLRADSAALATLESELDVTWTAAIEHAASVCESRIASDKNPTANNEGRKCALAIRQYVNRRSVQAIDIALAAQLTPEPKG